MIKYSLRCRDGHRFESWFADADAFDALSRAGHVACAVCGSGEVEKSVMAPSIGSGRAESAPARSDTAPEAPARRPLSEPATPQEAALRELRRKVERESEYVGRDFARHAREIHSGEAPHRAIHGEAKLEEARALIEEGVPVAPLPFAPSRKAN